MNPNNCPLPYELRYNGKANILIATGKGYEPFLKMCDILTGQYGLKLVNCQGITDMRASFEFGKYQLVLEYYSYDEDTIMLQTDTPEDDQTQMREFRMIAMTLRGAHKAGKL